MKNDSSETDDDLQYSGIIKVSNGLAHPRVMPNTSGPVSCGKGRRDMDFQIHFLEMEAYSSVLKAFVAQSDVLSWDQHGLITQLRKELKVSDVEHSKILGKINSDASVKSIKNSRELLKATLNPSLDSKSLGHVPNKRLKRTHISLSSSMRHPTLAPTPSHMPLRRDQLARKGTLDNQSKQPSITKARGSLKVQSSNKSFAQSSIDNVKSGSDIIEIPATDAVIHEVEKICGADNPDPAQVQRAKALLMNHERALLEAIAKLADASDRV
ncbi:protein EMSY-LIKE 3-like [Zingiber officinale]|uniref:protein EMSY-LIKE 3-like n=1 Tax=Zingiber officinale TaxID=94328 RepID=UPI001C4B4F6B|nr:protein EMSY-LIKE 3-like [Zingiber officinale]